MYIPTNCPSCNTKLNRINDQLFCPGTSCPAKAGKSVEGYCKSMRIKGFGSKTIEKLGLSSILDLYSLKLDYASDIVGEKTAQKLISEVDAKREVDFGEYVGSLGIPLIGTVAGRKITQSSLNSWDDLLQCDDLLGNKATSNLVDWSLSYEGSFIIEGTHVTFTKKTEKKPTQSNGKTVVITGKLADYKNRAEASAYLKSLGYDVKGSVSKNTNFLIVEDGSTSSKTKTANDLGIPILTIKQLVENIDV